MKEIKNLTELVDLITRQDIHISGVCIASGLNRRTFMLYSDLVEFNEFCNFDLKAVFFDRDMFVKDNHITYQMVISVDKKNFKYVKSELAEFKKIKGVK